MKRTMCVAVIAVIATACSAQAANYAASTDNPAGPPGYTRFADSSGAAGSNGALGAPGGAETQQGAVEQPGALTPVVVADHWTPYRSFRFDDGRADIRAVDERQVTDTAAYLAQNPSLRFGIDDSVDPGVTDAGDLKLGRRRVAAVRDALIHAGTPASRIEMGAFADPQRRRNQQVELLLITAQ
jgi:outer membrane protein OmpA-like peptidoglycan-associated protein